MNLCEGFADTSRFRAVRRDIQAQELGFEEQRSADTVAGLLAESGRVQRWLDSRRS